MQKHESVDLFEAISPVLRALGLGPESRQFTVWKLSGSEFFALLGPVLLILDTDSCFGASYRGQRSATKRRLYEILWGIHSHKSRGNLYFIQKP